MRNSPTHMDWHYLNNVLNALPGYVEIEIADDHGRVYVLMARDLPVPHCASVGTNAEGRPFFVGRRFTNLTTGTEWFTREEGWLGVVSVTIPELQVEVP